MEQKHRHIFSATCLSANEIAGCDLLVLGNDPQITKEGMINGLYASWIEASHEPTPMLRITISYSMTPKSFVWYF